MRSDRLQLPLRGALRSLFLVPLIIAPALSAQNRLVLPQGSVIMVQTTTALESATARTGQTFETIVADTVGVDNYTVIPSGSRIRGLVTLARPVQGGQSGVIEVTFDRLTLADGTTYPIAGKLTSTDAAERRQIDADPNAHVVLVGGRGGIGAAIAGAGSNRSSNSILAALGSLLSQAQNVSVPAGTTLAVQLDQQVILRGRGRLQTADENSIYTATDRIRAAQQALAQQNYYRGVISGRLDDATRRALFNFQTDKGIVATGNLDWRTAQALGISSTSTDAGGIGGVAGNAVLSLQQASNVRRSAENLAGTERQDLGITGLGALDVRRGYAEGDVDLWFALSAFADNASLYEQLVRSSSNAAGSVAAGQALIRAARRVDDALTRSRASSSVQTGWASIRQQLNSIDGSYTTRY